MIAIFDILILYIILVLTVWMAGCIFACIVCVVIAIAGWIFDVISNLMEK